MMLFLLACGNNGSTNTKKNTTTDELFADISFVIRWEDDAIYPEVKEAEIGSWWFGLAEQGADIFVPWSGEDCFEGDEWQNDEFTYCHPIMSKGSALSYANAPTEIIPGEQTFVSASQNPNRMMYYFLDALSGTCFIDGSGLDMYLELCSNQFNMTILY